MSNPELISTANLLETVTPADLSDSQAVISIRHVGKMYRLYERPQDRLKEQLFWRFGKHYGREFWALHDISFDVKRGETVGIIGRNGSGKSTLLQIIAGTLAPTTGEVKVTGRVAALLELGSGFNPEFTGRENVFLNGSILGLSPEDMAARFDKITAFADIGKFIDQPVKLYSSGMLMRLAFAVQAHVEADLLIVDEALSVGDIYFQHKCMRRIKELVDRGTTLLLVSHSTDTVKRFCEYGLWLDSGEQRYFGAAGPAAEKYLAFMRMLDDDTGTNKPNPLFELAEPQTAAFVARALPCVTHKIDLLDARFFFNGTWDLQEVPGTSLVARVTSDPSALAGLCFTGNTIELTFVCGPEAGLTKVTLDTGDRLLDLHRPVERSIQKIRLDVPFGDHTITIGLAEQQARQKNQVVWLGGQVDRLFRLEFHRDPRLSTLAGEVERYGNHKGRLTAVELLDYTTGQPITEAAFGQRVNLRLHAELIEPAGPRVEFSFIVRDRNRIDLFGTTTVDEHVRLDPQARFFVAEFSFDVRLGPGSYSILAAFVECSEDLGRRVPMDSIDMAYVFSVGFDVARPVWYMFHEPISVRANVE